MPSAKKPFVLVLPLAACVILAACSDDGDRSPRRAVQSPYISASPESEVMGAPQGAVPLVSVELPNKKGDPTVVHTIGDSLAGAAAGPLSRPATTPASQPAAGPGFFRVVQQKVPADLIIPVGDGDHPGILITSASGIGNAVIERSGEQWPAQIVVHFTYPDHVFPRLEGFDAKELTDAGNQVSLKADIDKDAATATIHIPAFVRSARISLEWVDMYR